MTSMNISVSEPMREWVEDQIRSGSYGNVSEYVRDLIRQDQKRKAEEHLEALILAGIQSGPPAAMNRKDWDELRAEVARRLVGRRGGDGKKKKAG